MNVLIVPSWYPTRVKPIEGVFFREQLLALRGLCDARVLYGVKAKVARKSKIANLVSHNSFRPIKDMLIDDDEGWSFQYLPTINALPKINAARLVQSYVQRYTQILDHVWRADVVHAHDVWPAGVIAHEINRLYRVPCHLTIHNMYDDKIPSWKKAMIEDALATAATVSFVGTVQQRLWSHVLSGKPSYVIGNMVDDDRYIPQDKSTPGLLFVGRNRIEKDLDTFVNTLEVLSGYNIERGLKVTIVSQGLERDSYKMSRLDNMRSVYNINIMAEVDNIRMPALMNQHTVLISTSRSETFGCAIVEAAVCGLEIVTTKNGGIDTYLDQDNAFISDIGDSHGLARSLYTVLCVGKKKNTHEFRSRLIRSYGKKYYVKRLFRSYYDIIDKNT